ncbi:probable C-4 sterol methyl oxidase [Phialocephala subalpina]|uniref:Probable C-4 sterol methyl oxidase n=1 Tax=Phialocephala subalpina TaxID=576137 RepID=A0A1L7XSU4_9HELO|nr:probable C-4 sterol methyl oxidase [Phialocephala subalpina]
MIPPWTQYTDQLDQLWAEAYSKYPPSVIEFVFTISVQILAFWVPATIYLSIDLLFPVFSRRHKIQSERRQPSWRQIRHCVGYVGLNEVIGAVIQVLLRYIFGLNKSLFVITRDFPSLSTIVFDFIYGLLAREISFYYIHRAFHHPRIYGYIHKKHHKFTAPMAFSAQYAHLVEHIAANMIPIVVPLALRRANLFSFGIFVAFELWEAAADHSGYDFVKLPPAQIHDLHHEKFRVNYGTLGIMDWIHGTDVVGWDKPKKVPVE